MASRCPERSLAFSKRHEPVARGEGTAGTRRFCAAAGPSNDKQARTESCNAPAHLIMFLHSVTAKRLVRVCLAGSPKPPASRQTISDRLAPRTAPLPAQPRPGQHSRPRGALSGRRDFGVNCRGSSVGCPLCPPGKPTFATKTRMSAAGRKRTHIAGLALDRLPIFALYQRINSPTVAL